MKRTKKNSTVSSAKAKTAKAKVVARVKQLAAEKKKARAPRQRSSPSKVKDTERSMVSPVLNTRVEPLLEGVVKLDEMTFKEQANLIFDPLTGINPKYIVGKKPAPKE